MNLQRVIKQVTFDKIVLFFSITIIVGLYYEQYLYLIKPAYALLILGSLRKLLLRRNLVHSNYIFISLLFLFLAFLSSVWSFNPEHTTEYFSDLSKAIFLSIFIINLCDSKENSNLALFSLAFSGILFGLIYLSEFDIANLGANRISVSDTELEGLPNENVVAILVGFSFAYFIMSYFLNKNKTYFIIALFALMMIILLGSRKTIINAALAILFLIWKLKFKYRFSLIIFLGLLISIVSIYIPQDYTSFIIERFLGLSSIETMGDGDQERMDLLQKGLDFISESPLIGQGYYIFEQLYHKITGVYRYSHNNFIEILVGLGFIGFILYYSIFYIIFKRLYLSKTLNHTALIFGLCLLNLIDHLSIVVSNLKSNWLLIAILFASSKFYQREKIKE